MFNAIVPLGLTFSNVVERLHGAPPHLQIGGQELKSLPIAMLVLVIAIVHVIAFAVISRRLLKVQFASNLDGSAYVGLGYALFGFYVWLLGYLHLLNPLSFCLSAILVIVVIRPWPEVTAAIRRLKSALHTQLFAAPILTASLFLMVLLAFLSGLRGIQFDDDYHWQSAVIWADAHQWIKVPYRLTNGMAMSEMFHVVGAVFGSTTGAHWMSTLLWMIASINAAALARRLGISAAVALAAVFALPTFTSYASSMGSDLTSVAFALSAFVFLFGEFASPRPSRSLLAAGILFAAVLSTKFIVLACFPAAVLLVLRKSDGPWRVRIGAVAILALPVCICAVLWACHTYRLIGRPYDDSGKHMARTPDDPMWKDGEAAGRIPSFKDLVRIPIEPWMSTIWGQREPYGGRSGLVWPLLLPPAIWLFWRKRLPSRPGIWLLFVAFSSYILLAPIILKTRFLLLSFLLLSVVAAAAFEHRRLFQPMVRRAVFGLFVGACAFGMFDATRKLLLGVVLDVPPPKIAAKASVDSERDPAAETQVVLQPTARSFGAGHS